MISVIEIYEALSKDIVNGAENGRVAPSSFNRKSRRAELRLMDYLTGDVEGVAPPAPYLTQKNKDLLSDFLVSKLLVAKDGKIDRPADYYQYDNLFYIEGRFVDCDQEEIAQHRKPIELLDGSQFSERCDTSIEELKPENKPIAKIVKAQFVFAPKDIGNVQLEYIKYPKFAELKMKKDLQYNNEVPDPATSINYEWPLAAMDALLYFMTDFVSVKNRDRALKEQNELTNKSATK
jgi:hypothetical protein